MRARSAGSSPPATSPRSRLGSRRGRARAAHRARRDAAPAGLMNDDGTPQTVDVDCACDDQGEPYRRKPRRPRRQTTRSPALDGGDRRTTSTPSPTSSRSAKSRSRSSTRSRIAGTPKRRATTTRCEFFKARMWPIEQVAASSTSTRRTSRSGGGEAKATTASARRVLASVTAGAPDPFDAKAHVAIGEQRTGSRHRAACS
jgi:hypothetical protein